MAILKIIQYPNPLLKRKAYRVKDVKDPRVQQIIADMIETLAHTSNCAALAATQLAIDIPPSITVINSPVNPGEVICLVNPEIISASGKVSDVEGCMSVYPAEINAVVERSQKVQVKAQDRTGELIEFIAEDYFARCIQHELDHLNGMLYIDRLSPLKKSRFLKKITKLLSDIKR
ncbi:MAG: peptide deformylase [Gammaproteobacteria bacterium]|nr:peptide deformylase [Gammaproteobacteria bacterium]